ncbi:MAG: hypothetical protein M1837_006739 [Sclerophora amabilis]|nr:MAG: hypothetical protein M1837_006739 [Sclerophora amabilis]
MDKQVSCSSATESTPIPNSEAAIASYAFLVHSQHTLPLQLPPDVDNKSLARQKRRRTSPEDQAILEAEYQRNSKPDKAARMDIVRRVALGEKEVQIWFQNRRQNTRRRSKPLRSHELFPSAGSDSQQRFVGASRQSLALMSGDDNMVSKNISSQSSDSDPIPSSGEKHQSQEQHQLKSHGDNSGQQPNRVGDKFGKEERVLRRSSSLFDLLNDPRPRLPLKVPIVGPEQSSDSAAAVGIFPQTSSKGATQTSKVEALSPDGGSSQDALGGRIGFGTAPPSPRSSQDPLGKSSKPTGGLTCLAKEESSSVRLSLSLEGKAQVVTGEEPSPPRSQHVTCQRLNDNRGGLKRSQSLVAPGERANVAQEDFLIAKTRHSLSGRSRDSRTWQFYCDSDARNALSAKADQERRGSAVGAIEMLRHQKNESFRLPNNKRYAPNATAESSKRLKSSEAKGPRPMLNRAASSVARLPSGHPNVTKKASKPSKMTSEPAIHSNKLSPSGDSDKENRVPGNPQAGQRRRRLPQSQLDNQSRRLVLKENKNIPSHSSSLDVAMALSKAKDSAAVGKASKRSTKDGKVKEKQAAQNVEIFEDDTSFSPEEEELNCVQNLLSLSQGDWK